MIILPFLHLVNLQLLFKTQSETNPFPRLC